MPNFLHTSSVASSEPSLTTMISASGYICVRRGRKLSSPSASFLAGMTMEKDGCGMCFSGCCFRPSIRGWRGAGLLGKKVNRDSCCRSNDRNNADQIGALCLGDERFDFLLHLNLCLCGADFGGNGFGGADRGSFGDVCGGVVGRLSGQILDLLQRVRWQV